MARILLADDSADLASVIRTVLALEGHVVDVVSGGHAALRALSAPHPAYDLLLCDLVMPEGDGIETIQTARRLRPALPILAMSGNSHAAIYLHSARLLGATAALGKPFGASELLAAVQQLLAAPPTRHPAPLGDLCSDSAAR
jgi:CheY-like chemotaxis protein